MSNSKYKTMTIHEALRAKLNREPTHVEFCSEVKRILEDGAIKAASSGKLRYQRKRR